ncbi:nitrate reductase [Marinomonas epiphytica]
MTTMSQKTTCPYCGVGCGVKVTVPTGAPVPPVEGDESHPANFGKLCVKGSSLSQTLHSDDRLLHPSIGGRQVSWNQAIEGIANKIQQVVADHGADAFAFYLSGQILTEDYYVANKLAKGFIGTANVDTNSRLCMASAVVGYKRAFGSDTVPCCYEDLEECDLLIMVGSNAAWTHPILYQRISAAKQKRPNMKVVVIDPRETATCDIADLHLAIKPGTDAAVFSYLLVDTVQSGALDQNYVDEHTNQFDQALAAAQAATPSLMATADFCGVSSKDLQQLANWWQNTPKTISFYSQGVNQSSSGVDKCNAIINCHLATGRIGKIGAGPFSITGQPNAMGGREVGGLANQLAAHMDFATPGAQDLVGHFWQAPKMASENGLKAVDLFQAIEAGKVKVVWIMSTNPMVSLPDTAQVRRALEQCELVIVSDCKAHTDTTAMADILLPATGWSEKDGTVTNSERRISRQRGLLPAPGEAKHDWWAISQVGQALGFTKAFDYSHPRDIFVEHAALSAYENNGRRDFDIGELSDLSLTEYNNLSPVQWPVPKGQPQGTKRMFENGRFYTANSKANFIPVTPKLPQQGTSPHMPFILNTGRVRDQWHTMTRTGDAGSLAKHTDQPYVELHPDDARRLNIVAGGIVKVFSKRGEVYLRARISPKVSRGELFAPIHWTQQFASAAVVSNLIAPIVDPLSGQPESKHGRVNLLPVENLTYGFLLSHQPVHFKEAKYWCRIPTEHGFYYQLAWSNDVDSQTLRALIAEQIGPQEFEDTAWLKYQNPTTDQERMAYVEDDQLRALLYLDTQPVSLSMDWLQSKMQIGQTIAKLERLALLAGLPADVEDKGTIVCSCFQIGSKQIEQAIAAGESSVEGLGSKLKCGTNCGSCIPELKQYLPQIMELTA